MKKLLLAGALFVLACRTSAPAPAPIDWTAYGHDAGGTRHSPAAQITRDNVGKLEVAWTYRTGDYGVGQGAARFETTPLLVDGTLFLTTPFGRVIALTPTAASNVGITTLASISADSTAISPIAASPPGAIPRSTPAINARAGFSSPRSTRV